MASLVTWLAMALGESAKADVMERKLVAARAKTAKAAKAMKGSLEAKARQWMARVEKVEGLG